MTSLYTAAASGRSIRRTEWIKSEIGANESAVVFDIDYRELIISIRRDVAPAGTLRMGQQSAHQRAELSSNLRRYSPVREEESNSNNSQVEDERTRTLINHLTWLNAGCTVALIEKKIMNCISANGVTETGNKIYENFRELGREASASHDRTPIILMAGKDGCFVQLTLYKDWPDSTIVAVRWWMIF